MTLYWTTSADSIQCIARKNGHFIGSCEWKIICTGNSIVHLVFWKVDAPSEGFYYMYWEGRRQSNYTALQVTMSVLQERSDTKGFKAQSQADIECLNSAAGLSIRRLLTGWQDGLPSVHERHSCTRQHSSILLNSMTVGRGSLGIHVQELHNGWT